jgi:hypothetical protein
MHVVETLRLVGDFDNQAVVECKKKRIESGRIDSSAEDMLDRVTNNPIDNSFVSSFAECFELDLASGESR